MYLQQREIVSFRESGSRQALTQGERGRQACIWATCVLQSEQTKGKSTAHREQCRCSPRAFWFPSALHVARSVEQRLTCCEPLQCTCRRSPTPTSQAPSSQQSLYYSSILTRSGMIHRTETPSARVAPASPPQQRRASRGGAHRSIALGRG
jgi:hypothetical protein